MPWLVLLIKQIVETPEYMITPHFMPLSCYGPTADVRSFLLSTRNCYSCCMIPCIDFLRYHQICRQINSQSQFATLLLFLALPEEFRRFPKKDSYRFQVVNEPVTLWPAEEPDRSLPHFVLDPPVHGDGPGAPGDDDIRKPQSWGHRRPRGHRHGGCHLDQTQIFKDIHLTNTLQFRLLLRVK